MSEFQKGDQIQITAPGRAALRATVVHADEGGIAFEEGWERQSCVSCKHSREAADMYPCSDCTHGRDDLWEPKR